MNNSDVTVQSFNMLDSSGSTGKESNKSDLNLKLSARPVKHYKLVRCDKNKIQEYSYLVENIRAHSGQSQNYPLQIYLKKGTNEEVVIANENEWISYFQGRSIREFIDSKNTLKIEYNINKPDKSDDSKETKLKAIIKEINGNDLLRIVFNNVLKNNEIKNEIKDDMLRTILKKENLDNLANTKYFDSLLDAYLKMFFNKTLDKLRNIESLRSTIENDSAYSEDNGLLKDEDLMQFDVQNFSDVYKNEEIEVYRSRILSETFSKKF